MSGAHAGVLRGFLTETEHSLCTGAPAPVAWNGPAPSGDSLSTRSEVFCRQLIDHSSSRHSIAPREMMCRHEHTCKHTHVPTHTCIHTLKHNQILQRRVKQCSLPSWSGNVKQCPAVALQAGSKLESWAVTAIVKHEAKGLAGWLKRLQGLVKSEQKAQFWADRTRRSPGFTGHVLCALLLLLN